MLRRWYYRIFFRHRCFKNTLAERKTKWGNLVGYGDSYLGRDWWLKWDGKPF